MKRHMLVAGLVALLGGCGDDGVSDPPAVASVTVSPAALTLEIAETRELTAAVTLTDGSVGSSVAPVWTSSDTAVARVSATGVVEGVGEGFADVDAEVGGKVGTVAVRVNARALPAAFVRVRPDSLPVGTPGMVGQFFAEHSETHPAELQWRSRDTIVARVDTAGIVTTMCGGATWVDALLVDTASAVLARDSGYVRVIVTADMPLTISDVRDADTGASVDPEAVSGEVDVRVFANISAYCFSPARVELTAGGDVVAEVDYTGGPESLWLRWDTRTVPDGRYQLVPRVVRADGSVTHESGGAGIVVRNSP